MKVNSWGVGASSVEDNKCLLGHSKKSSRLAPGLSPCKGRGSIHASSHGLSAGDSRLSGRVDRRPREMGHLRGIARDPCSGGRAGAYMAPSYSIGCAATEEHSWGAGDRQSAGGTLSGMRERERERERGRRAPRVRPYPCSSANVCVLAASTEYLLRTYL